MSKKRATSKSAKSKSTPSTKPAARSRARSKANEPAPEGFVVARQNARVTRRTGALAAKTRDRARIAPPRRHRSRAAAVARGDPRRAEARRGTAAAIRARPRDGRRQARARRLLRPHRRDGARRSAADEPQRASCASSPSSISSREPCKVTPTASDFSSPTTAVRICSCGRARCTRCSTATARRDAAPAPIGAAGRKARSSTFSCARTAPSSDGCTRSAASASSWPRTGGSIRTCSSRRTSAAARKRATSSSSRSSSSLRRNAKRSRASSKSSAATPIPGMEIEIALRKHDLPHEFSLAARKQAGKLPGEVDRPRSRGPHRRHVAAARHHRRRDREGLRRRRLLRARRRRLSADRRDRRRLALREGRRRARSRRARAGNVGLFPAPRDPDAARGALERALLAQAQGRPALHGVRDGDLRRRDHRQARVLSRGDALARAAHLHAGVELAVGSRGARRATRSRCCGISPISTRSSTRSSARAKREAQSTSTASRWSSSST